MIIITKRKFHLIVALLSFLSFFAPVRTGGETQIAAKFFLIFGTLITVFTYLPGGINAIFMFFQEPSLIADAGLLKDAVTSIIYVIESPLYFYAIPVLLLWSLFFSVIDSGIVRIIYRFWLIFSLASSIHLSLTYAPSGSGGLGYWLNPILLLMAAVGEFLIWIKDRQFNRA
ncbi:MAG TPA: hypothetical protein VFR47_00735 [Anaerolineales bacterium]|nr:hypothetical protein [Anaerolineales bacterium]